MKTRHPSARTQSGAVLFFTLIALVAMTLAALALVRSVSTSNLVAGNIALKQGAVLEAEARINEAYACLDKGGALFQTIGLLDTDQVNAGTNCHQYYSTIQPDTVKPFGFPDILKDDAAGLEANSALKKHDNPTTRNTSVYVIERMCIQSGTWTEDKCLVAYGSPAKEGDSDTNPPLTPNQALYRLSVRVYGPGNVNAFSQMMFASGQ